MKIERQLAFVAQVMQFLRQQPPSAARNELLARAEAAHLELQRSTTCQVCGGPVPKKARPVYRDNLFAKLDGSGDA